LTPGRPIASDRWAAACSPGFENGRRGDQSDAARLGIEVAWHPRLAEVVPASRERQIGAAQMLDRGCGAIRAEITHIGCWPSTSG